MDSSQLAKLSYEFINSNFEHKDPDWKVHLSKFTVSPVLMPEARTYHASTLVQNYMIIVGGESISSGDLNDFWLLDLETSSWIKPDISGLESFTHKRFHTASSINTKVITFGGCHSEYVHLNDLNIFELSGWLCDRSPIICSKVAVS
jgi:hypothetical protein